MCPWEVPKRAKRGLGTSPNNKKTESVSNEPVPVVNNTMVYKTPTGTKYHKMDCSYLSDAENITSCTITEAENLGLEPCSRCQPNDPQYTSYEKMDLNEILSKYLNN